MRDLEKRPYSADEKRVAEWLFNIGVGGGDDPIGFLIVSHEYLAAERKHLKNFANRLIEVYAPSQRKEVLRRELDHHD